MCASAVTVHPDKTLCSPFGLLFSTKLRLADRPAAATAAEVGLVAAAPAGPAAAGLAGSRPRYSWRLYAASAAREVKLAPLQHIVHTNQAAEVGSYPNTAAYTVYGRQQFSAARRK
jgi:hypothetical protein